MDLALDSLSVSLLVVLLILLLAHAALRSPVAQAHPMLLGKQGDSSTVRNAGESAVWRSNQSLGRMVALRPSPSIRHIADLLAEGKIAAAPAAALAAGFAAEIRPGPVAIYTDDYEAAFAAIVAVSTLDTYRLVLLPATVSSSVVAKHLSSATAVLVSSTTQREAESCLPTGARLIVAHATDDTECTSLASLRQRGSGTDAPQRSSDADPQASIGRAILEHDIDGVTEVDVTEVSITAAAYTYTHLLPMAGRITPQDVILSCFDPSTPFGLGLAFAVAYTGATLRSASATFGAIDVIKAAKAVEPTLIFAPSHVADGLSEVLGELATSCAPMPWLVPHAYVSKVRRLRAGFVGPHAFWDPCLYSNARREAGMDRLRALFLYSLQPPVTVHPVALDRLRAALSCPVLCGVALSTSTAPILTTHPYDLQAQRGDIAHSGPPAPNVACKVVVEGGESSASADGSVALTGELLVSSPSILRPPGDGIKSSRWQEPRHAGVDGGEPWFQTGLRVHLRPNGTFIVLS